MDSHSLHSANGRFATGSRTLDDQVNILNAHGLGCLDGLFCCQSGGKGSALARLLNPEEPALPQQTVLPCVSVTVTIVLLKDAKTCTWAVCKARLDLRVDDVRRDERTV